MLICSIDKNLDNLCKCSIIVMDLCYMCKKSRNTPDHMLLQYDIVRVVKFGFSEVWSSVLCLNEWWSFWCVGKEGFVRMILILFGILSLLV